MGINPRNEEGKWFRVNNVTWHPLWRAICRNTPELTDEDFQRGSWNDCYEISGDKHFAIMRMIEKYADLPDNESMAALSVDEVDWYNMKAFLTFCEGNDGFKIC